MLQSNCVEGSFSHNNCSPHPLEARLALRVTCWEGPWGAVSELERPSWFVAALARFTGRGLEQEHGARLTADVTVGGTVERLAAPVRGQHAARLEHARTGIFSQ
eukprot:5878394-Pyramimonas_sp.AAC.2